MRSGGISIIKVEIYDKFKLSWRGSTNSQHVFCKEFIYKRTVLSHTSVGKIALFLIKPDIDEVVQLSIEQ